jgi:hypothetical protein
MLQTLLQLLLGETLPINSKDIGETDSKPSEHLQTIPYMFYSIHDNPLPVKTIAFLILMMQCKVQTILLLL